MDEDSRIVVVELPGRTVGFVMDAVREVIRVERSVIEPPPELAIGIDADYLSGVAKLDDRLLILLDVERVLADEEQAALPDALPQGAAAAVPAAT
jgi:purine-binding chemotaxis protein CheW